MRKFFKQLFCKHEWKTSSNSVSIEDFNTHKNTVVSEIHKVCKKCGKQIVMAIALYLVCTVSFGQESSYVRFTGTLDEFLQYDDDFIIAKKLNGKNICVFNGEFDDCGGSNPILLKMLNDSTVICQDSLTFCILGKSVVRNKDFKYMGLKSTGTTIYSYGKKEGYNSCGSHIINFVDEYTSVNICENQDNNFIMYFKGNSDYYIWLHYYEYSNKFCSTTKSVLTLDYIVRNISNLEIYIKQRENSSTTNINSITAKQNVLKCIKNGKLTIQKCGKTYDILGNQIKN